MYDRHGGPLMKWHPHLKFAMPGVMALLFASLFGWFIPYRLRVWVYLSVVLTLLLGLITGQFHQIGRRRRDNTLQKPDSEQKDALQ